MTQKDKEILCLATAFLNMYVEEDGNTITNDINELYDFIRLETYNFHNGNTTLLQDNTRSALNKINELLSDKPLSINVLSFAVACCIVIRDNKVFLGSKQMKLNRLSNYIFSDLEKTLQGKEEFKNALKLIFDFNDIL